ncbi:hypothetical protein BDB00DRAFT_36549 [Zychaea mexicana]|uniref:uncharacterized protein n=1 Tax=Zychaea mexicana TaxID=64656 RepID=UPI0022FE4498|nr:uncharacterized protein BDB00DRAFT_36549 [Zychaea mexicana]KAI9488594.1 hypothetical protein BDB00DRAFT_36549 [Zychaea mexicana]
MADLMNSFGSDINDSTQRPIDQSNNSMGAYHPNSAATSADHCAQCGDEFDYRDDVVNDRNKYYHKQCYTCQLCRAPFDHRRPCFEHNGKLYCERDYNVVKKRITCAGCDRLIAANANSIKALGQHYHPGHVKCYHCYQPIDERTGYKEHQGRLYCRADFKALFLPSCRACGKPVERQAVSATDGKLQGKWHLECFGCHTCHREFPDNTFYVFDNAPYCKRHYHQLNNSLCRTCDEPIEGPCAQTIEGWRFHPACFRCNVRTTLLFYICVIPHYGFSFICERLKKHLIFVIAHTQIRHHVHNIHICSKHAGLSLRNHRYLLYVRAPHLLRDTYPSTSAPA